jgi:hypothetical protein
MNTINKNVNSVITDLNAINTNANSIITNGNTEIGELRNLKTIETNGYTELLKRTGHVTVDELVRDYGFERDTKEGKMKLLMDSVHNI